MSNKWLSSVETENICKTLTDRDILSRLFALREFIRCSIIDVDFSVADEWVDAIKLTKAGEEFIQYDADIFNVYSRNDIYFSLFLIFYFQDILIDHSNTNIEILESLIDNNIKNLIFRLPYIYGIDLYNKFNDNFKTNRTNYLDHEQTKLLLDSTPQGVFQINNVITGPFGLIISDEKRFLLPTLDIKLWHCSDPGCVAPHDVTLQNKKHIFMKLLDSLNNLGENIFGQKSQWRYTLIGKQHQDIYPYGRKYYDIPTLIGDCILDQERLILLSEILSTAYGRNIRNIISMNQRTKSFSERSSIEVSKLLSYSEQLQLILIIPDDILLRIIDDCVKIKKIYIPPSETRSSKHTQEKQRLLDENCELSSLGIRSSKYNPSLMLAHLIWDSYEKKNLESELLWRLRGKAGLSLRHLIFDLIREQGPSQTVHELILSSKEITERILNKINMKIYDKEKEEEVIERLLWKVGFNMPRYEKEYMLLKGTLDEFKECILRVGEITKEDDRATIRSKGVNFFVYLELYLQFLLEYNVWLMTSDHFLLTNFSYKNKYAKKIVSDTLGKSIISNMDEIKWKLEETNTIGTLLTYSNAYNKWLKNLNTISKDDIKRSEKEFPHYSKDPVKIFPYKHTQLWADLDPGELAGYTSDIDRIITQLNQADLAYVRNGLDHWRDPEKFPSSQKLLATLTRFEDVFAYTDIHRYIPKTYFIERVEADLYGNQYITFKDYIQRKITITTPFLISPSANPLYAKPYIIAPRELFGQPNSYIMFSIIEESEYSKYWEEYPKRRTIPPG